VLFFWPAAAAAAPLQDADLILIEYSVNGCSNNYICHSFASPRVSVVWGLCFSLFGFSCFQLKLNPHAAADLQQPAGDKQWVKQWLSRHSCVLLVTSNC
jgi:hypothetical protein